MNELGTKREQASRLAQRKVFWNFSDRFDKNRITQLETISLESGIRDLVKNFIK